MLIADRYFNIAGVLIDLASGERADMRALPAAGRLEHADWLERCAIQAVRADTGHRLVDFGLLDSDRRFEAYAADPCMEPPAIVANDLDQAHLRHLDQVLATARLGEPRRLALWPRRTTPSPHALDHMARIARTHGFVPVSAELAMREAGTRPAVVTPVLATRHVLLIARKPIACLPPASCTPGSPDATTLCPLAVARLIVDMGATNCRPTVMVAGEADPAISLACRARRAYRLSPAGAASGFERRPPGRAAEAHERYVVTTPPEVSELRSRAVAALHQGHRGPQRIEHGLREVAGALHRRDDLAGAACLTLNLGCLLLERGRALDAARAFDDARRQFDRVRDACGAIRASIYLGLAWTDEARFAEAGAALRTARIGADQAGAAELEREATLGLARCLYWDGRFDEAYMLVAALLDSAKPDAPALDAPRPAMAHYASASEQAATSLACEAQPEQWGSSGLAASLYRTAVMPADPDPGVRTLALAVRLALGDGDLRRAMELATTARAEAERTGRAVDACIAETAQAAVHAALEDLDAVSRDVRSGLGAARRAHAPLRALRLRLLGVDAMRQAGRCADTRRAMQRLHALDRARFPALLRSRLDLVAGAPKAVAVPAAGGRPDRSRQLAVAACPWRPVARASDVVDDVVGILGTCHEVEDEEAGLERLCEGIRARLGALLVGVLARDPAGPPTVVAHSGCPPGASAVAERVVDTGLAATTAASLGVESAWPSRYAGVTVGAVFARWACDAVVDEKRAAAVLAAASAAAAPHVRSFLDRQPRSPLPAEAGPGALLGDSAPMQALRRAVRRAAAAPFPVLIEGESGSGKELVARAIHRESARRLRRFCAVNCAALTDDLLEAELFGHARGAFTGAVADRMGLFEEADGGTLFLDEVADLSPRGQAKLLRVLQEGEVRRVGENLPRVVDVRVVAATNRDLQGAVQAGAFRQDLFYRLHVVRIAVPPLRARADDVPLLAGHFWQSAAARTGSRATLTPATLAALARYDWPGNVRELQNVMAALAVSAPQRGSIAPACLPPAIARSEVCATTLDAARHGFERSFVRAALARSGGHRGRAAAALGLSRQGLAKLMTRLGIDPPMTADSE